MSKHGNFIKQLREQRGISQRELATKIGLSHAYINKIETGKQRGSYHSLTKIAKSLNIAPQKILEASGFLVYTKYSVGDDLFGQPEKDFAELPPILKSLILEVAPILYKYLKIANERGKANLPV